MTGSVIAKYKVIDLKEVQKWIDNGWQPWGPPFMYCVSPGLTDMRQAVVKYKEYKLAEGVTFAGRP